MESNNTNAQLTESAEYKTFGKKVFWLFFLESVPLALALCVISIFPLFFLLQPSDTTASFSSVQEYNYVTTLGLLGMFVLVIILSFAVAWPNYKNSLFSLEKFFLKIKRGVFEKTEISFPYKLIQGVDIKQGLLFKIFGLSQLVISTGNSNSKEDDFDGVISAIDQVLAEQLKAEILKRSNDQKAATI